MLAIQGLILAITAAFLATVNSVSLQHLPFYEAISQGENITIIEHGPFTFSASCDSESYGRVLAFRLLRFHIHANGGNVYCMHWKDLRVQLNVLIEATEKDYIFTDQGSPEALLPGNTSSYNGVFRETRYGNDFIQGGFVSSSGYYAGWDGESVIGLHMSNGATEALFGDNITCVISGVIKLIGI